MPAPTPILSPVQAASQRVEQVKAALKRTLAMRAHQGKPQVLAALRTELGVAEAALARAKEAAAEKAAADAKAAADKAAAEKAAADLAAKAAEKDKGGK